ncbi:MAG: WD40/YVTN/BNR-like repeat-containing protein [Candidatus Rokuibacteriota bacterium]
MTKRALTVVAVLLGLAPAGLASAGIDVWTSNGPPGGGTLSVLAIDPTRPTTLYAGGDGIGVFKSLDGGASWRAVNIGLGNVDVTGIVVAPSAPGTLYVGTNGTGVFKSTNGGGTWTAVNTGLRQFAQVTDVAVDPSSPTTAYAALLGDDGVFKTVNGGATWTAINTGLTDRVVGELASDPRAPGTLYAGTNTGVFKTIDGGQNWMAVNTGLPSDPTVPILEIVIDPATSDVYVATFIFPDQVFKTTDGGDNWTAASTGITSGTLNALAVAPTTPATLYAASAAADVFKSANAGGNWALAETGLDNRLVRALAADPVTTTTAYAATIGGLFKTTNAGVTWSPIGTGVDLQSVAALATVLATPGTVYAGTSLGLFKSVNRGGTWADASTGLTSKDVSALAVDPTNPNVVYAGTNGSGVFKSLDGGGNWSPADTGIENTSVLALAVDPTDPNVVYAGTLSGGVFKSLDGGGNWSAMSNGLGNANVVALAIDPGTPAVVYAGTPDGVFKTPDGGANWSLASTGLTSLNVAALAVDPVTPAIVYVTTRPGGVFKSLTRGDSWSPASDGLNIGQLIGPFALVIDPTTPSTLYVGGLGGVSRTTDGAGTWTAFGDGIERLAVGALAIDAGSSPSLYAGTRRGVFEIQESVPDPDVILFTAVLPSSRSVQTGGTATAFLVVINAGITAARGVRIGPDTVVPAGLVFQTTDPRTNQVTGTANTPVDVPPGAAQTFVIALTTAAPFDPTELEFSVAAGNAAAAGPITGVNTLAMSVSDTPVPDVVALAATLANDGIVNVPGAAGTGVFAVAAVNVGATGTITASADTGAANLPVTLGLCQTIPATGLCMLPPASSVTTSIAANATPAFGIFVQGQGVVPFDPAGNRVFVRFIDDTGVVRGSTSVAVRTQ